MSSAPADRVERVLPIALALVAAVREGPDQVTEAIDHARKDTEAVLVALAALVPDDRSVGELLEWYHGEKRTAASKARKARRIHRAVAQCGTRSGYGRHRDRNEQVCDDCRAAESEYQAMRHVRRKAKQTAAEVAA